MATLRPPIDKYNAPYWTALREGRLRIPRCRACGNLQYPMGPCCSNCLGDAFDWMECSGRGTVWSYIVYHHAFHPSLVDKVPYNVAEIVLEEGPRIISNVVGIAPEALHSELQAGLPVEAKFQRVDDELTLLRFAPSKPVPTV